MKLEQALSLGKRETISLVGGGGKTTLMYALGRKLSLQKRGIILTTTTKISDPEPSPFFHLLVSKEWNELKVRTSESMRRHPCLLIAGERLPNGKLDGILPEWVEEISRMDGVSIIVNEADGAAGRPLKAHREGEPVIPKNTTLVVPVMGIDGLGCPLDEASVFRSEIASRLLDMAVGSRVTEEVVVRLLKEWMKNFPPRARVVPLINKTDLPGGREKAQKLARCLLSGIPDIRRVMLCSLRNASMTQVVLRTTPTDFHLKF